MNRNTIIGLTTLGALTVAGLVGVWLTQPPAYSTHLDGEVAQEGGAPHAIDHQVAKVAHVLRRDHGVDVPTDVLNGWTLTWCEGDCSQTASADRTIRVARGTGWADRVRHEVTHAVLFAVDLDVDHHEWMGEHGWCFGSANCDDVPEVAE